MAPALCGFATPDLSYLLQGAFALDPVCLTKCGLPATGGDLSKLSTELQVIL